MWSTIPVGEAVCGDSDDTNGDERFLVMSEYYELVDDLLAGHRRPADELSGVLARSGRRMQELQEDYLYFLKRGTAIDCTR